MDQRSEQLLKLAEKARMLPRTPGVYLMKDSRGRVIYVGKARALRSRVGSYFQRSTDLGPKKGRMLEFIEDFDFVECESEWEALLSENRLIKDLKPRFNARLTDDKTFPYLVITVKDDFPGVFITREPNNPAFRGAKVYGPFTSVYSLRQSISLLQRVFRFRTCELEINDADDKRRFFRPCLLYSIRQCSAPCGMKVDRETYRADIERFIRFLESKRSVMLRQMRKEMEEAAAAMQFEKAASLRDQIKAIEKLDDRGKKGEGWQPEAESMWVDPRKGLRSLQKTLGMEGEIRCIECIDIAHLQGQETVGSKVCFVDGRPLKNQYRRFRIRTAGNDDFAAIREVVSRAYRDAGAGQELYPDLVIIDGGPGQLSSALAAFEQLHVKPPMVIALAKKEELIYQQGPGAPGSSGGGEPIRLGRENLGLKLCQAIRDEAHRFAQSYHHILRRKKVLEE